MTKSYEELQAQIAEIRGRWATLDAATKKIAEVLCETLDQRAAQVDSCEELTEHLLNSLAPFTKLCEIGLHTVWKAAGAPGASS